MTQNATFRFPFIRPVVPPIAKWAGYLDPAYRTKWFSNFGPVVRQFETELSARLCHDDEVITTANSCTSGIASPLIARNISGAVLIPAFTFPATVSAVIMAGAEPRVLDVDLDTWCLSPSLLKKVLCSEKCSAVVLVAPFGLQQNFSPQIEICREHNVLVLIDNAAGLDTRARPLVDEDCFEIYSLHATKPFAIGEGGAIRSRAGEAEALRHALNFGLEHGKAVPGCWGINGKLPEVSAAIGLAVLEDFDDILVRRRAVAKQYIGTLREHERLIFPSDPDQAPWQAFPVAFPSTSAAEEFIRRAATQSLHVRRGYSPTLEGWPRTHAMTSCPNARSLSERMVLLPVYSDATADEIEEMTAIVRKGLRHALTC